MSSALAKAIKLREWTRKALEEKTDLVVADLNTKADLAYDALSPEDARLYRDWAFGRKTKKKTGR